MATNDTSEDGDPGAIVFGITEPMFILVMFELFFYGAYTMLFGLYVYLQIHQRGRQRYYQISLLLLYLLATAAVVILIMVEKQMTLFTLDVTLTADINDPIAASHFRTYASLTVAADGVYVAANIIADALLLYRCYIVWASRKYIIAIPVLISLINTVIAIIAAALVKNNAGRLLVTAGVKNSSLQVASIITDRPPLDLVPPPPPSFPRLLTPTWLVETRIAGARDSSRVHTCLRYTQTGYVLVMLAMMYAFGLS